MDAFIDFLIQWGYLGMFLSAVLAGSVVPFSSEAVLAALVLPSTGLNPVICLIAASVGNLLGSLTCYGMGRLGRMDWLEKYFHMKREKVERMQAYLNGRSAFMAFFAFLPIIGSVIAVALGFLRSNIWVVSASMLLGKVLRYVLVILAARGLVNLMI
ncbi:DedA family protein [Oscillospiraceae bacterium N12]|jgi:membrane protein YqaA with SNARE-associated domain|uniref:DedA family protein n=1 Tax=Jilunia laotingensis TaxID=2763675 RepID=A0A926F6B2_9BACT|nr:VTT domain-containing protein [Jilunia laotingensis]MBC8592690.1 DedA family protein [Jilunia laotingensis]